MSVGSLLFLSYREARRSVSVRQCGHTGRLRLLRLFRVPNALGIATRYDKLLANFKGFVLIAAIVIWLK